MEIWRRCGTLPEARRIVHMQLRLLGTLGLIVLLGTSASVAAQVSRVGLVTDVGKVDDGTFNEFAHKGMMRAVEAFNLQSAFIETQQPTDYEKNIEQLAA